MSIFTDFVDRASARLQEKLEDVAPIGGGEKADIGGSIFEAIYQYGRGRAETAQQVLVEQFRRTKTGQAAEREATAQRIKELLPPILIGAVAIIGGIFLLKR